MQVDRARALRSEEGTVVENCSLSRRVARVAANGESGDGGGREHRPWERRRLLFIGYPRFENLTVSPASRRAHATAGSVDCSSIAAVAMPGIPNVRAGNTH